MTVTVTVSPLSAESTGLAVIEKAGDGFVVRELNNGVGTYEFDYMIMGTRRGAEAWPVITPKRDDLMTTWPITNVEPENEDIAAAQ